MVSLFLSIILPLTTLLYNILAPLFDIKELLSLYISGGQAKTLMFVHISPELDAVGETLSTLKFAERVSTVELGAARVNKDNTDVKELKEQVLTSFFVLEFNTMNKI